MSKYAEQIAAIDERTKHILNHCQKLNDSQAKQWDQINKNEGDIKVLNTKVSTWAGIQAILSAGLATIAAGLGMRK